MNQEKLLQLQMIDAQLQQAEKELQAIEAKHAEITALRESLEDLKKTKKGSKMFSPIGFGIYTEGNTGSNKELLVNVGSGVVIKKPIDEVKKVLESQVKQFKLVSTQIMQSMQMMAMQAQAIENELAQTGNN